MPEKPPILGKQSPPPDYKDYAFDTPAGAWTARLDYLRWGKSAHNVPNLVCYFTDIDTGKHYLFSAFKNDGYGPFNGSVCFRHEHPGNLYRLTTSKNSRGKPVWHAAQRLESKER